MPKDARILTAFSLSVDELKELDYLKNRESVNRSVMVRRLIKRSYNRHQGVKK